MAKRKAKHVVKKAQAVRAEENVSRDTPPVSSQNTESKSTDTDTEPLETSWTRVFAVSLLVSLFLILALHTDLFSLFKLNEFIDRKFIAYTEAFVDKPISEDIRILTIEEDQQKNGELGNFGPGWRKYHSQLIDALSRAGAKVIAFDMYFEDASPENDENFGKTIQRATQAGTKVVIGVREYEIIDGKQIPQVIPALADYLDSINYAALEVGGRTRESPLMRKLKLAEDPSTPMPDWIEAEKYPVIPSYPLQVVTQYWGGRDKAVALYLKNENQISVQVPGGQFARSIPVDRQMDFIFDVADKNTLDQISFPYSEVILHHLKDDEYLKKRFGGKIVLVGVKAANDLQPVSANERRYGIEILASVTSNLLQGFYIRTLSDRYRYLLILVMCLIGALLATRFRHWLKYNLQLNIFNFAEFKFGLPISIIVVSVVYLLASFLVYVQLRRILDIPYHLAALVITFYVMKLFTRRQVVKT
jgi:CHASE2 domain-containing sensor protein